MDVADMLAQIERARSPKVDTSDEWKTAREWHALWSTDRSLCLSRVRDLIRDARAAGLMDHAKRPRELANGCVRNVDCYRWVGQREDQ